MKSSKLSIVGSRERFSICSCAIAATAIGLLCVCIHIEKKQILYIQTSYEMNFASVASRNENENSAHICCICVVRKISLHSGDGGDVDDDGFDHSGAGIVVKFFFRMI